MIAFIGTVPGAAQAGMPLMVVPGGYTPTQRRPIGIDVDGGAYDEFNMIGVGYVIEQSLKLQPVARAWSTLRSTAVRTPNPPSRSRAVVTATLTTSR